jgi:peptide/nickel transport system ATP-binding protein
MRKKIDTYLYETALNLNIVRTRPEAEDVIEETLSSVGLHFASITNKYLNQFSGGELQRISIARAMIPRPRVIVADEPVSMIDASMRMNIVNLFMELRQKYQCSFIYITHDLSTAYHVSDVTAIMYRGSLVEYGNSEAILTDPCHPYTELLLDSIPIIGKKWSKQEANIPEKAVEIQQQRAECCKFADRCVYVQDICRQHIPPLVNISENRTVSCFKLIHFSPLR